MTCPIRKLLIDAAAANFTFAIGADGETDYEGCNVDTAMDAIEALEDAGLTLIDEDGYHGREWATIIMGLDGMEKLADFGPGPFINRWFEENA